MDLAQVMAQNTQVIAQNTLILTKMGELLNNQEQFGIALAGFTANQLRFGTEQVQFGQMLVAEKLWNRARHRNVYARAENSTVFQAEGILTGMYNCNENLAPIIPVNDLIPGFPCTPAELIILEEPACIMILTALGMELERDEELRTLRMKVGKAIGLPTAFLMP